MVYVELKIVSIKRATSKLLPFFLSLWISSSIPSTAAVTHLNLHDTYPLLLSGKTRGCYEPPSKVEVTSSFITLAPDQAYHCGPAANTYPNCCFGLLLTFRWGHLLVLPATHYWKTVVFFIPNMYSCSRVPQHMDVMKGPQVGLFANPQIGLIFAGSAETCKN